MVILLPLTETDAQIGSLPVLRSIQIPHSTPNTLFGRGETALLTKWVDIHGFWMESFHQKYTLRSTTGGMQIVLAWIFRGLPETELGAGSILWSVPINPDQHKLMAGLVQDMSLYPND